MPHDRSAQGIVLVSITLSVLLAVGLGAAFLEYQSELALAMAADSVSDVLTASAMLWALRVSRRPRDSGHPFGHQGAQPVAALVVAVLAGILALEVFHDALQSLLTGERATFGWPLLLAVGAKVLAKGVVALVALRPRARPSSVLRAVGVDARNDLLVGLVALAGLLGAEFGGVPSLDAWLALPVALWIGASGVLLGWENIQLLMGAAAPEERVAELARLAAKVPGVVRVADTKARYHGNDIHVWIEIRVDPSLTVAEGHDLGEAVERRLEAEDDVCEVVAHVDAA